MEHNIVEFKKTPVVLMGHDEAGEPVYIENPAGEPLVVYGCDTCEVGEDEAANTPCLGRPLESILEDGDG